VTCETCPDLILCWQNQLHRRQCHYCKRWEVLYRDPPWDRLAEKYGEHHASVLPHTAIFVRHCPPSVGASRTTVTGDPTRFYPTGTICYECRKKHGYSSLGEKQHVNRYFYDD
jgi:hypothetical protein